MSKTYDKIVDTLKDSLFIGEHPTNEGDKDEGFGEADLDKLIKLIINEGENEHANTQ